MTTLNIKQSLPRFGVFFTLLSEHPSCVIGPRVPGGAYSIYLLYMATRLIPELVWFHCFGYVEHVIETLTNLSIPLNASQCVQVANSHNTNHKFRIYGDKRSLDVTRQIGVTNLGGTLDIGDWGCAVHMLLHERGYSWCQPLSVIICGLDLVVAHHCMIGSP